VEAIGQLQLQDFVACGFDVAGCFEVSEAADEVGDRRAELTADLLERIGDVVEQARARWARSTLLRASADRYEDAAAASGAGRVVVTSEPAFGE
jgi:hypothetical protein